MIQPVSLHEFGEFVRTEHHRLGYGYLGAFQVFELLLVAFEHRVDKGQTAPLPTHGAVAYSGEVGIAVEAVASEHGHHAPVLEEAILLDGVQDEPAQLFHVYRLPIGYCDASQVLGQWE